MDVQGQTGERPDLAGAAATIAAMPSSPKFKWIVAFAAVAALFALPTAAQATLTFVKNPLKPVVYVAADDGSGAHRVGAGSNPRVSPDGETIAYQHEGPGHSQELMLAPAGGGASRPVLAGLRDSFYLAFSPDSKTIAALRGPELGKRKLVLVDVASGTTLRTIASGYFSGFSFSPDGAELAYGKAKSEKFPPRSDVYTVPTAGGKSIQLTKDHSSQSPLWGPAGKIVFVKQLGAKQRRYGPKNELFLVNPNGTGQKRLTHTKVDPLLLGLAPTEWSADGNRLLAEFQGQDTSYAVTVDPRTGAQRPLDKMGDGEQGFVGTALSGDGTMVLGFTGGFEPGPDHRVATIPYGGGKVKTLVKNGFEPDWSR
jgi:dipeptidyl aminopeptidase/acylaminoacyl peptidase